MSDLSFAIQIIFSTLAAAASYALLMSVFKKEVNQLWFKSEAVCALVFGVIAVVFGGLHLLQSLDPTILASGALLSLGVMGSFSLVMLHALKVRNVTVYPTSLLVTAKFLSVALFVLYTGHILLEFLGFTSL